MWDEPLVSAGDTLDTFGSIALHISIGIENDCFDLFERTVRELEAELKAGCRASRFSTADIATGLSQEIDAALVKTEEARRVCDAKMTRSEFTLPAEIRRLEGKIAEMESKEDETGVAWALQKKGRGGGFKLQTEDAKVIQEQYTKLTGALAGNKAELVKAGEEAESAVTGIVDCEEELSAFDGPLMAQVKEELVRLRAQKQVFHGGHYNGPDLEKVMTVAVIERMVAVLSPQRFTISDSDAAGKESLLGLKMPPMTVGSFSLAEKFRSLFHKLRHLRYLYRPTRALCKHEVAQLRARAISLGHWFPINFPGSSITPKMHWLIYHIPEIAARHGSSGQTVEQAIESFHANLNVHGRHYICMQNALLKHKSQMQNSWARAYQGSVRSHSSNKKQQPNHKRKVSGGITKRRTIRQIATIRKSRRCSSLSKQFD